MTLARLFGIIRAMRPGPILRSAIASCLVVLLGALGTGLPSHHHEGPARHADGHHTVDANHHSHGTLLIEQDDRVQSAPPQLAMASQVALDIPLLITRATSGALRDAGPARERAPPPDAPRAPPLSL